MTNFQEARKRGVRLTGKVLNEKLDELNKELRSERLKSFSGRKAEQNEIAKDLVAQIAMISQIVQLVQQQEILNQSKDEQKKILLRQKDQQKKEEELEFSFGQYKKEQMQTLVSFLEREGVKAEVSPKGELKITQPQNENQHIKQVLQRETQVHVAIIDHQ